MKKRFFNSSFEVLFTAGVVVALALPQFLFAQKHKEVSITIHNNDTTFNGKSLKDMKPAEKQDAIAEINKTVKPKGPRSLNWVLESRQDGPDSNRVKYFTYRADSVQSLLNGRIRGEINDLRISPQARMRMESADPILDGVNFNNRPLRLRTMRMGNTQNFDYNNTDKDGISTNVSYHVTEAFTEAAKKVSGVEKSDLELQDITLTPQFSAGKTTIAFTLPAKTTADVQLTDSEGKSIWKDKATTASFSKSFTWGLNGVYYLVVKQGGKTAVKRIVKE
jgi:hypothetical protein